MISTETFFTNQKAAVTDGRVKVTFDTPSDFADWLDRVDDLRTWQWVSP